MKKYPTSVLIPQKLYGMYGIFLAFTDAVRYRRSLTQIPTAYYMLHFRIGYKADSSLYF